MKKKLYLCNFIPNCKKYMRRIFHDILPLCCILLLPLGLAAQKPSTDEGGNNGQTKKKSVVKINKLDVIYEEEGYSGIVIDNKPQQQQEEENYLYERPFIITPPPMEEPDEQPMVYQNIEDEGAESEEDILYASFDSEVIHAPKMDISMMDPVTVRLTNEARGEHFAYPTPSTARVTSHFGPRRRRFHYGLDLALPTGEPIYATFDGVVRISKYNRSYGNLVVIRHFNGLETYYAHMSRRDVVPGDHVKAGDIIGLCGNTGRSYGSHLHFEIRYQGNAMNPENVIDCATQDLIDNELVLNSSSFRKVAKPGHGNKSAGRGGSGGKYYKVRRGDTLSKIAKRNGTTVRKLCQLNGIRENSILREGKRLKVR